MLSLPPVLTELVLSDAFNQPLDNLPNTLSVLQIGYYDEDGSDRFNHPLDNLPPSLLKLQTGTNLSLCLLHLVANLILN